MRTHQLLAPVVLLALVTSAACITACGARHEDGDDPGDPTESSIRSVSSAVTQTITQVTTFGSNPGGLNMYEYVPSSLKTNAPLVVVLHGCTETAQSAAGTGWNDVADEEGFAVVYPEQETINNPVRCFNWAGEYGDPSDIQRGKGENLSIKQMVDTAVAAHKSDTKRVFVVGFSAGGGTSAIMAATYPDVFAGGATIAGIPYDCTTTYAEVNGCMSPGKTKTAADWAALVKAADPGFAGPWPRMSIWQGSADTTVAPANRMELVKQWTGVHGVDAVVPVMDTVGGQSHAVYKDAAGNALVETFEIAGMSHAVPVMPSAACGTANQYAVDKGICAARQIAAFFQITAASAADGGTSSSSSSGSSGASSGASGGVSSSSSTGGVSGEGGTGSSGASSGSAADPGDAYGRHGSTCAVSAPIGSSGSSTTWTCAGLLLGITVLAMRVTRARSRR